MKGIDMFNYYIDYLVERGMDRDEASNLILKIVIDAISNEELQAVAFDEVNAKFQLAQNFSEHD